MPEIPFMLNTRTLDEAVVCVGSTTTSPLRYVVTGSFADPYYSYSQFLNNERERFEELVRRELDRESEITDTDEKELDRFLDSFTINKTNK